MHCPNASSHIGEESIVHTMQCVLALCVGRNAMDASCSILSAVSLRQKWPDYITVLCSKLLQQTRNGMRCYECQAT